MSRAAALLVCCSLLSGCYNIRFHRRVESEPAPTSTRWHHAMVNGVADLSGPVKVNTICPDGFAVVENRVTFLNGLANFGPQLVLGSVLASAAKGAGTGAAAGALVAQSWLQIYTPSTVQVTCEKAAGGRAPEAAKPEAGAAPGATAKAGPPPSPAPKKRGMKIAVTKLVAKTGVDQATADLFTDALVGELRKSPDVVIVSPSDIASLLGFDKQKQLLGCSEASCLAEIGGALGAERLISGNVGRVGNSLMVYLSSMDPVAARTVTSVSERLKSSSDEAFLDSLPRFAFQLLKEPK